MEARDMADISRFDTDEYTTIQRAAIVGWELATGRAVTTTELVHRFGIDRSTALRLLELCSLVLPIVSMELPQRGGLLEWSKMEKAANSPDLLE